MPRHGLPSIVPCGSRLGTAFLALSVFLSCTAAFTFHPSPFSAVTPSAVTTAGTAAMRAEPPNRARRATGWISVVSRGLARHTDYPRIQSTTASTSRLFSSLDESDSGDLSDQEEWKALVASLKMYKAAYGNLKVPSRFVVPAMAPWPSEFFWVSYSFRFAIMFVSFQPTMVF